MNNRLTCNMSDYVYFCDSCDFLVMRVDVWFVISPLHISPSDLSPMGMEGWGRAAVAS